MHVRRRVTESNAPSVSYSVVPALFESAGLLLDRPSGLSIASILRIPSYCSLRGHITQSEWHAAANSIAALLPGTAVNRLFDAFYNLSQKIENRLETTRVLLGKLQESTDASEAYVQWATNRAVSLPGFVLFLMVQVFLEQLDPTRTKPLVSELDPEVMLQFVRTNLSDIVSAVSLGRQGKVTVREIAELRFVLRETSGGQEVPMGTSVAPLWPRGEHYTDVSTIVSYIRQRLVSTDVKGSFTHAIRGVKGVHFVQTAPPPSFPNTFKISQCSQASIYVTAPMPSTSVFGCANSTIALGPVGGLLCIDDCEHCIISAICSGVRVSNCKDVRLYICTNSPPLIIMGPGASSNSDQKVYFGPYHSFYPTLEDHLAVAGTNPQLNFFRDNVPPAMHLPPKQFVPLSIPVPQQSSSATAGTSSMTTRTNPCVLPPEYAEAVQTRLDAFHKLTKVLHDANAKLMDSGRKEVADSLKTKIHSKFQEWLQECGQSRVVLDILHASS